MRHLPKYVHGFLDRHGEPRFYFRRPGFKQFPLPCLPWSPEFMRAYEEALTGQPVLIGSECVKPGTIRALAVSYYNSVPFRSMKPSTQSVYRNIIDRFCRETDKDGHEHGDKRAATLQRGHIVKLMAARAQKAGQRQWIVSRSACAPTIRSARDPSEVGRDVPDSNQRPTG